MNVNDNAYHHVTLVRGGKTATLYVDGVQRDTVTTTNIIRLTNPAPLQIGASVCTGDDGTLPMYGQLDEIEIFNRVLTPAEILALATSPLGKCLPVEVEIKPGKCHTDAGDDEDDDDDRQGVVPLTINGSALVDALQLDISSLTLGGSPAKMCKVSNEKKVGCKVPVQPADAYPDLQCQFYVFGAKASSGDIFFVKGKAQTPAGPRGVGGFDVLKRGKE